MAETCSNAPPSKGNRNFYYVETRVATCNIKNLELNFRLHVNNQLQQKYNKMSRTVSDMFVSANPKLPSHLRLRQIYLDPPAAALFLRLWCSNNCFCMFLTSFA